MVKCNRPVPAGTENGVTVYGRCEGQLPGKSGTHICPLCGGASLVMMSPGVGENIDKNRNKRGRQRANRMKPGKR
jgi:hypothetical protein